MKLVVLETRQVTLALILKGEDGLPCRGGHNPEELSRGFSVTTGIYSMYQTSCGMEDQNTFLFHPWSFRKTRAAMYSLGRVSVCLLEMGLLRPGVNTVYCTLSGYRVLFLSKQLREGYYDFLHFVDEETKAPKS